LRIGLCVEHLLGLLLIGNMKELVAVEYERDSALYQEIVRNQLAGRIWSADLNAIGETRFACVHS